MPETEVSEQCVELSLVVPAYNEQENILPFFEEAKRALMSVNAPCEIVYIDDGSSDDTFLRMREAYDQSDHNLLVQVISFSRNFGKEAGMYAGLKAAKGKYCCLIDSDLQQRPETAVQMYELLQSKPEYDCVAAFQEKRNESLTSWFSEHFYKVLSRSSGMNLIESASDFRVFSRAVADSLISMPETSRFSKGLFAWIGYKTLPFPYTPDERHSGSSTWSIRKLFAYAVDGLISFSTAPLRFATYLGTITSLCAFIYLIVVLIQKLVLDIPVPGYTTLVVLILFLGGIQLLVLGIIGEYLAKTYLEGKHRPLFIIKEQLS